MNRKTINQKIFVVVPTIRENSIKRFLEEWREHFQEYQVVLIIVEDNPKKLFEINVSKYHFPIKHFSWQDIDRDLGKNSWIIPRRDGSIKSYGFWKAYQEGADVIVALDDDCYPLSHYRDVEAYDFLGTHLQRLNNQEMIIDVLAWENTIKWGRQRGMPYKNLYRKEKFQPRRVILNHGLWYNVPDIDAPAQLVSWFSGEGYGLNKVIPKGKYFPMSGMNLAFKREVVPMMYFLLMGQDKNGQKWKYCRFDDVWAGIFVKKIADHLDLEITSGDPIVWHERASNVFVNLEKESTGIGMNEYLWSIVDDIKLKSQTIKEAYRELAEKLPIINNEDYWKRLKEAMIIWTTLF